MQQESKIKIDRNNPIFDNFTDDDMDELQNKLSVVIDKMARKVARQNRLISSSVKDFRKINDEYIELTYEYVYTNKPTARVKRVLEIPNLTNHMLKKLPEDLLLELLDIEKLPETLKMRISAILGV